LDLKKRLIFFTRMTRILVYFFVVSQYLFVREHYRAAEVVPVLIALGVFYILLDRIVFRVPEQRFKATAMSLMLFEIFLVSLLIFFTRSFPIVELDFLYALPIANIWFGLKEGMAYGIIGCIVYTATLALSGRLAWAGNQGEYIARYFFFLLIPFLMGYLAEFTEKESKEKARRVVELTALSGFATVFDSTLIEGKVYANLANVVSRSINPGVILVFRFDEEGENLVVAASSGVSESEATLSIGADYGMAGRVLKTREPLLVADTDKEQAYRQLLESSRIRSAIYTPMKWREENYGVVFAGNQ
jgi:hypothetical protein